MIPLAVIPSPTQGVWQLGPVPLRAYALCIVLGIVVACVVTDARLRRRGAPPYSVLDIAVWAVPFGIVGARIYHVITSPDRYFGGGGNFVDAFKIWEGGLGIWGAVAGGAVGAWIAAKRLGLPFAMVADTMAIGLPLAQAVGRWGNWFNNELYGRETDLPWALKVYNWDASRGKALVEDGTGEPIVRGLFHPTFLYESLWCVGVAVAVWLLDRRFKFGRGRAFALYAMLYCVGRFWIELMRSDPAAHILGMRLNNWTAILVFAGALIYFLRVRGPQERVVVDDEGVVTVVSPDGTAVRDADVTTSADGTTSADEPGVAGEHVASDDPAVSGQAAVEASEPERADEPEDADAARRASNA